MGMDWTQGGRCQLSAARSIHGLLFPVLNKSNETESSKTENAAQKLSRFHFEYV
jgi:hypothetical protein